MEHRSGTMKGAGNVDLFHQSWRPEGPPKAVLLYIHGIQDHSDRFLVGVRHFVPQGFAVYGLDLRGHGRSGGQRGFINTWTEYRDDVDRLRALAVAENPGVPVFLLGHSMGGLIVLEYALNHPERIEGVVALAPGLSPDLPKFKVALAKTASGLLPRLTQTLQLDFHTLSRDPAVVQAHYDDKLRHTVATARLGAEGFRVIDWLHANAVRISVPLLIQHGDADAIATIAGSRAFIAKVAHPDKQLIEYPGCYHIPFDDINRAEVLGDLERWIVAHLPAIAAAD